MKQILKTYIVVRQNTRLLNLQWLYLPEDKFLAYDAKWMFTDLSAIKFGTKKLAKQFLETHLSENSYTDEYQYMILEREEGLVTYV